MSIYLSRLILNPRSPQVQAELREPYQMHRTLSKAFGDGPGEWQSARILFRVDELCGRPAVIVQSRTQPDWSRLSVSSGYLFADPEMKEINPSISAGQRFVFRLRANPTKRITDRDRVRGDGKPYTTRVGLFGEEKQLDWLRGKAENGGFRLVQCSVSAAENSDSRKAGLEGRIRHLGVTFEGILEATDPDTFAETLASGVGSAKGFGFGLLSVVPVR
jgi:CRISPR system Cascade subunit CasE